MIVTDVFRAMTGYSGMHLEIGHVGPKHALEEPDLKFILRTGSGQNFVPNKERGVLVDQRTIVGSESLVARTLFRWRLKMRESPLAQRILQS